MTQYLKPSFSVGSIGTQQYRDNHDAIFGKKEQPVTVVLQFRSEEDKIKFLGHISNLEWVEVLP